MSCLDKSVYAHIPSCIHTHTHSAHCIYSIHPRKAQTEQAHACILSLTQTHAFTLTYMHTHICMQAHTCTQMYTYELTYTLTYVHTHIHRNTAFRNMYIHVCMRITHTVYPHARVYRHTYIYANTHIRSMCINSSNVHYTYAHRCNMLLHTNVCTHTTCF